jgi:DNA invertase Pin-like site-specific DNA recombinase
LPIAVLDNLSLRYSKTLPAFANPALKFDDSIATKAVIIVMGLASEIERHFIRTRTRQSLAIRKELIEKQGYFLNKKGEKVYQLGAKKGRFLL